MNGVYFLSTQLYLLSNKMAKCRASHAEFVVPYQKYVRSINNVICIGTRFKMRVDVDDAPEKRFVYGYIAWRK